MRYSDLHGGGVLGLVDDVPLDHSAWPAFWPRNPRGRRSETESRSPQVHQQLQTIPMAAAAAAGLSPVPPEHRDQYRGTGSQSQLLVRILHIVVWVVNAHGNCFSIKLVWNAVEVRLPLRPNLLSH